MRIISGTFKGKKIIQPKDLKTRPLKDLVKESVFNILEHSNKFDINLDISNILDIFSGVGSFGLECLSRGVKQVTFIENYKEALTILKKNLSNLKTIKNLKIIEGNAYDKNLFYTLTDKYDLAFLDPPYKDENLNLVLNNINSAKILKKGGILVIHRHKNSKDIIPEYFEIVEEKKYGISKVIFLLS